MADISKVRVTISVTPIITRESGTDTNAIEVFQHDVGKTLGTTYEYTALAPLNKFGGLFAKWYYSPSTAVTSTASNLIGEHGSGTTYTDGTAIATTDKVHFLYVEHLGIYADGTDASSNPVSVSMMAGDANNDDPPDSMYLFGKFSVALPYYVLGDFPPTIASVHSDTTGGGDPLVKVLALCGDAHS